MPLLFLRTSLETDPQRSLFDPTVAGRSFERSAYHNLAKPGDRRLANPRDPRSPRLEDPRNPRDPRLKDPRNPCDPRLKDPRNPCDPRLEGSRNPRLEDRRDPRPMTGDLLSQRLAELDLKRRRAQIRARKALDAPEPAPMELPFPERAVS